MVKRYLWNILISIDQFANTLLGGNPDETISGRMGTRIKEGRATRLELWLCAILSKIDTSTDRHCVDSIDEQAEHY